jgi:hypothetical protein
LHAKAYILSVDNEWTLALSLGIVPWHCFKNMGFSGNVGSLSHLAEVYICVYYESLSCKNKDYG